MFPLALAAVRRLKILVAQQYLLPLFRSVVGLTGYAIYGGGRKKPQAFLEVGDMTKPEAQAVPGTKIP